MAFHDDNLASTSLFADVGKTPAKLTQFIFKVGGLRRQSSAGCCRCLWVSQPQHSDHYLRSILCRFDPKIEGDRKNIDYTQYVELAQVCIHWNVD